MKRLMFGFLVLLSSLSVQAHFLPPDIQVKETPNQPIANMTEAEFNEILGKIKSVYEPVVKAFGGRLVLSGPWKSDVLNAGATRSFGAWKVMITGAIARRPELTADGFTLIVCHELGHHISGFPFAPAPMPFAGTWASAEGQADYFATHSCTRKLWQNDRELNASFASKATSFEVRQCASVWDSVADRHLCLRTLAATKSMTATMAAILKNAAPSFDTPDPSVVEQTKMSHPGIQCRMDTSLQGALCQAPWDDKVIPGSKIRGALNNLKVEEHASKYSCTSHSNFTAGLRPNCWFKAKL